MREPVKGWRVKGRTQKHQSQSFGLPDDANTPRGSESCHCRGMAAEDSSLLHAAARASAAVHRRHGSTHHQQPVKTPLLNPIVAQHQR